MSKAFAPGESDSDDETQVVKAPVLPPGVRNYMTPEGARKLEAERERLIAEKTALGVETVENKSRQRSLEQRLEFLTERLNRSQIIDPAHQPTDRVLFGAQVTVRDAKGKEQTWRIVGLDEMNFDKGWVSWMSPLANALLEKQVGDIAKVGDQKLTILKIGYST